METNLGVFTHHPDLSCGAYYSDLSVGRYADSETGRFQGLFG